MEHERDEGRDSLALRVGALERTLGERNGRDSTTSLSGWGWTLVTRSSNVLLVIVLVVGFAATITFMRQGFDALLATQRELVTEIKEDHKEHMALGGEIRNLACILALPVEDRLEAARAGPGRVCDFLLSLGEARRRR